MNLPLREMETSDSAPAQKPPQVFVRAVRTPPGAPWEQARAARMDAEHGAPLPIGELLHQVRRLDRWAPGQSGRYGAFYVRAREVREAFETTVEVDGQPVKVRFGAKAPDIARLGRLSGLIAILAASGALLGGGTMLALNARSEASAQLDADEPLASAKLRAAQAHRDRLARMRDLRVAAGPAQPLEAVIGDLTWVATSKTPEARIVAVHWERGLLAVEARGEQAPFLAVDRPLERSAKPLRPGVWLWGVGDMSGERQGSSVSAEVVR